MGCYIVIDSRRKPRAQRNAPESGESGSASLFVEGKARGTPVKGKAKANPNKLTHAQLRELEAQKEREAVQQWRRVQELWPRMLAGEDEAIREWLIEAEKLVESFRETRALFVTSRVRGTMPLASSDWSLSIYDSIADSAGCFRAVRGSRRQKRTRTTWRLDSNSN